jgi:hypothetical protein
MYKQQLKNRVYFAKSEIKLKLGRGAKIKFFDDVYGALRKRESMRLDNLWACISADIRFTEKIEKYYIKLKDGKNTL